MKLKNTRYLCFVEGQRRRMTLYKVSGLIALRCSIRRLQYVLLSTCRKEIGDPLSVVLSVCVVTPVGPPTEGYRQIHSFEAVKLFTQFTPSFSLFFSPNMHSTVPQLVSGKVGGILIVLITVGFFFNCNVFITCSQKSDL